MAARAITQPEIQLDPQRIAERAYAIWEREGKPQGRDVEIWLRAEQELRKGELRRRQMQR
jgi:Protein of unknown function (DUF2934)